MCIWRPFLGCDIDDAAAIANFVVKNTTRLLLSTPSLPFCVWRSRARRLWTRAVCWNFLFVFGEIIDQLDSFKVCENEDDVTKDLLKSPSRMPSQRVRFANKVLGTSLDMHLLFYSRLPCFNRNPMLCLLDMNDSLNRYHEWSGRYSYQYVSMFLSLLAFIHIPPGAGPTMANTT